jgi:hypothetical protein
MSTMKTMEEILVELGDVFGLSQFEQKLIDNNLFEIQKELIIPVKNSILQFLISEINNSGDEHLKQSKLKEIKESLSNQESLTNIKSLASKESMINYKMILSSIEIGLTEFFESKKTHSKSNKQPLHSRFHSYEVSLIVAKLFEFEVFSPDVKKAEIADAFSKLTGYNSKTIQNGLGDKALKSYDAQQYTRNVKNLFKTIANSL